MGIKKPPTYVRPKKNQAAKPVSEKQTAQGLAKPNPANKEEGKSAQFRLVARLPVRGSLPLYDRMLDSGLSPKEVILALLKHGLAQLDILSNYSAKEVTALRYETEGKAIETNRLINEEFQLKLQELFDPFGALSARAVGQRVGEALIMLVAKEKENE